MATCPNRGSSILWSKLFSPLFSEVLRKPIKPRPFAVSSVAVSFSVSPLKCTCLALACCETSPYGLPHLNLSIGKRIVIFLTPLGQRDSKAYCLRWLAFRLGVLFGLDPPSLEFCLSCLRGVFAFTFRVGTCVSLTTALFRLFEQLFHKPPLFLMIFFPLHIL